MHLSGPWRLVLALALSATLAVPAAAQQPPAATPPPAPPKPAAKPRLPAGNPTLLGQYGDWGAYTASPGGKKICFAIAKPTSSQTNPPNRPRDVPYIFISSRPADKVKDEVSVVIGYPFKPNSEATAEVGSTTFALYTQKDGAWIKNAGEEARMVEAMRAGQTVVVKGASGRGTQTTDVFSLRGLSQALDRVSQECR
jgi:invasion protein IalB